jgi:hypothetical protein
MVIYLSGPMSGKPDYNRAAFNAAASRLRNDGHKVFNPAEFKGNIWWKWSDFVAYDVAVMIQGYSSEFNGKPECPFDCLALLDGWRDSKGARLEYIVAQELGLKIINESEI